MKKSLIVSGVSLLVTSSAFALYIASHDEVAELEKDLVETQRDINYFLEEEKGLRMEEEEFKAKAIAKALKAKEKAGMRALKESIFLHKRCILANIKQEEGKDVSEESRKLCFPPAY